MDIHNYKGQLEGTISRLEKSGEISSANKKLILNFRDYLLSEGIGIAKINRYLIDASKYAKLLHKPLDKADKADIRKVVGKIEQSDYAAETKKCFKVMLRKLYRFLRGFEKKGEYPDEVSWISIHIQENHRKLPEELLSEEEMGKIVQRCETLRDKAMIATLAESGCRISEIGTMQIKHVSFEEYGARLTVNGKTGMRKILVINSAPYLQEWINRHPFNDNSENYLWISHDNKPLSYARFAAILKNAGVAAGIKKKLYPHLLRHSRATALASVMSDASMKHYFGWTQSSKMAGIYIHMSGRETDDAILKANGVEVKSEKRKPEMQPKKCLRCSTMNEATNLCCKICGLILDEQKQQKIIQQDLTRSRVEEFLDQLAGIEEFRAFIGEKAKEKGEQSQQAHP